MSRNLTGASATLYNNRDKNTHSSSRRPLDARGYWRGVGQLNCFEQQDVWESGFPVAKPDKVRLYLHTENPMSLYYDLAEEFGSKGRPTKNGTLFPENVFFKQGKFYIPSSMQLDAGNPVLLERINNVWKPYPAMRGSRKAKSVSMAEIRWDIPMCGVPYEKVEANMLCIGNHIVPRARKARYQTWEGEFQYLDRGEVNGKKSIYFYLFPSKEMTTTMIAYAKKYNNSWHIRIEAKVRCRDARSIFAHVFNPIEIPAVVARQPYERFFKFERVDFDGFCLRAQGLARSLPIGKQSYFYKLCKKGREQPAVEQVYFMKQIAAYLGNKRLIREIKNYRHEMGWAEVVSLLPHSLGDALTEPGKQ